MWRTILRNPLRLAILILSLLSVSISVVAQAPPLADTYAASSSPKTNYGKGTTLVVLSGATSYVQFNLAGVPANAPISKATLRVYVDAVATAGSFDVYQLNSAWAENTLTYNNAPALGSSATGGNPVAIASANLHDFVLVDITSLAQAWISGTVPNYGVALQLVGGAGSFSFDSKESTLTSHEPELEIVVSGSMGPQGAQGPAGLEGPTGPVGMTGAQGQPGANGTGFNFRNAFDPTASYAVNDVVTYNGSSYTAIAANTGPNDPTPDTNPSAWSVMVAAGAAGVQGAQGAQGTQGAQGPVGPTGPIGATGAPGAPGLTGAQGTEGAQGPQGVQGSQGMSGIGLREYRASLLQWYPQTFSVGSHPQAVVFDGTNIWVANAVANTITKLLASTGAVVGTYSVGQLPCSLVFDGTNIWVANSESNTVSKLLASTGELVGTYAVGQYPFGLAFDGANIWVANYSSNTVTELLASSGAVIGTYPVGYSPWGIAFDGANIWVANNFSNSLTKLLASTGAVVGTYSGVVRPQCLAFDGTNIWAVNYVPGTGTVTKVLASTGAVVGTYSVGQNSQCLAFDGTNIWVTNDTSSGTVTELLASNGALIGTYSAPTPVGVAFDGTNIWVTNSASYTVTKIPAN